MSRIFLAIVAAVSIGMAATPISAQTAADYIAAGVKATQARKALDALKEYNDALAVDPKNYEALWRVSGTEIDLGEFEQNSDRRKSLYESAERHARAAITADPAGAEGHFSLARALGRTALTLGARDRVKYAKDVREQALECLRIDPKNAGCLHVMGVWNAEVMRLSGVSRMVAKTFLGGKVFDQASWKNAQSYLVQAVTLEPNRITHRLDLARVYADMNIKDQAKTQYEAVVNGTISDFNDNHYKDEAQQALKKL